MTPAHLQGPEGAVARYTGHPVPGAAAARPQDQEALDLVLSKLAGSTRTTYDQAWLWWVLWCQRRGLNPVRHVTQANLKEEEKLQRTYQEGW